MFEYEFMKNALIAILIITPMFGILGTMVVSNRMAFFSDALGHSAFTGVALGILFGIADTNISMIVFAIVFALLLNFIKYKNTVSQDTLISVFSSLAVAIGISILSRNGDFSKYSSLLIGDILSVTVQDIIKLLICLTATIVIWIFCYNGFLGIGISRSIARSKKVKDVILDNVFVCLVAVVVMLSVRIVGILIINALIILPAATARNIAGNSREYHLYSVVTAVFSGVTGLIISYFTDTATGPMIAIIASVLFFVTFGLRSLIRN